MIIKYDINSGRILLITRAGKIRETENVLKVEETKLPKDFLKMFALGKYLVKEGEIIKNKKFVKPKNVKSDKEIEP
jgi:hypothetical protein